MYDGKPGHTAGPGIVKPGMHVEYLPQHQPGSRVRHPRGGVIVSVGPKCVKWRPYNWDRDVRTPLDHMRIDVAAHINNRVAIRAEIAALKAGNPLPYPQWTEWSLARHLEHAAARHAARLARLARIGTELVARLAPAVEIHAARAEAAALLPTPAPAPVPVKVPGRVVIIPCGAAKLDHPAPAGQLYTGSYHRACRRAADALTAGGGTVLILSALHGLTTLDRVLTPYDLRMGQPGSITGDRLREQARALGLTHARDVVILAGAAYTAAALQVWPHASTPLAGLGGMGHQLRRLAALREGRYTLAA